MQAVFLNGRLADFSRQYRQNFTEKLGDALAPVAGVY
jgi:hypothetical protein